MSDLNMCHEKMSDFVAFPLFGYTVAIKLRNFDCEFIKMLSYFLIKKYVMPDLNMLHGKMSHCFISIVWVYFSFKTENF